MNSSATTTTDAFQVSRSDLRQTRWAPTTAASPLVAGEARLALDVASLTANNITYGAFGDAMRYWEFFPSGEPAWGQIPVWGFATVVESLAAGVEPGLRVYGYFPMSPTLTVTPVQVSPSGFTDGVAHRAPLPAIYNRYVSSVQDPLYEAAHEGLIAVWRPLFTTSFLIDDFLADASFFGATQVVFSSASSKTAYAAAWCLARRGAAAVIGLTSPRNLGFVEGLGRYTQVLGYEQLSTLPSDVPTVFVDFAGSAPTRLAVHQHFGAQLQQSVSVGATDWQHRGGGQGLPGPKPQLFFAPSQAQKRMADWGRDGFGQRLGAAWKAFQADSLTANPPWTRLREAAGMPAIEATYQAVLTGSVAADEAWLLRFGGPTIGG